MGRKKRPLVIEFDGMGVAKCPNPECDEGYVSTYDRFCGYCGIALPLPSTLEALVEREDPSIDKLETHEMQKNAEGHNFCTRCGEKL